MAILYSLEGENLEDHVGYLLFYCYCKRILCPCFLADRGFADHILKISKAYNKSDFSLCHKAAVQQE